MHTAILNMADLPPQLSIDALNNITPNLADLPQICQQIYPQSSKNALNTFTPNLADLIYGRSAWQIYPHQSNIAALNTITPNLADLPQICWQITPQSSIDALNTITPNLEDLLADLIFGRSDWQIYPLPIEHSCLEYHYTKLADLIFGRSAWQIYPPPIKHSCLEYHYTKLGRSTPDLPGRSTLCQSSIDALNTITPNLEDLIFGRSAWQIYPLPIEHRCLAYHYTELGRSTPCHPSIDALNTITPNLADLPGRSTLCQSSIDALNTIYTKLGRSTGRSHIWQIYLADLPPANRA